MLIVLWYYTTYEFMRESFRRRCEQERESENQMKLKRDEKIIQEKFKKKYEQTI